MSGRSESDGNVLGDGSSQPYDCSLHDREWQLLCQSGRHLCLECAQPLWMSDIASDAQRRQLLCDLDSSLRYSSGRLSQAFAQQPHLNGRLLISISRFLFNSDPQIQSLAKNCEFLVTRYYRNVYSHFISHLAFTSNYISQVIDKIGSSTENLTIKLLLNPIGLKQLCVHSGDEQKEELFADLIQKITATVEDLNESILDLVSDLFHEQPIQTHPLKGDLNLLISWIQLNYFSFADEFKSSVLRSLVKLYDGSKRCHLFGLQDDLHLSHLKMALAPLEDQVDHLMLDSIRLLKRLSNYESVRKVLVEEHNPIGFFRQVLSKDSVQLKAYFIDWICQLLEEDNIGAYLASDSTETIIESLITMIATKNPSLMSCSFDCLNLILGWPNIAITSTLSQSLTKHIIQSLYLSDKVAETNLFKSSLVSLKYVIERNPSNDLFDEFNFFSVLDLFESCFDDSELFELILKLLFRLFDISVIPTTIPTIRMSGILEKILQYIPKPSRHRKTPVKFILMASDCVKLIEMFFKLLIVVKESELLSDKTNDTNILDVDNRIELSEIDSSHPLSDSDAPKEPKQPKPKSEISDFLKTCLGTIERFMTESLERLNSDYESDANIVLFMNICSSLKVLITNELLVPDDIGSFIVRMFSNGYLIDIYQSFVFATNEIKSNPEMREMASILAIFLVIVQQFEYKNETRFQFGDIFANRHKTYENEIFNSNEKFVQIQESEDNKKFYEIFFALNYFFFKYDQSAIDSIPFQYKQYLSLVINHYLKHDLSADSEAVPTVKHCLFLSSFVDFEDIESIEINCWKQFFRHKELDFVANYYTNHIRLVQWFFNRLKMDNLCEYTMREYVINLKPPEDFDNKKDILSLFHLVNSNQTALRLFIKVFCDPDFADHGLKTIEDIIDDNKMNFVDDLSECNEWKTFCDNITEQMPKILRGSIKHIRSVLWDDICPSEEKNTVKLLSFVSRLLINNRQITDELFQSEFHDFIHEVILLLDQELGETSIQKIFDFLMKCYQSSDKFFINEKSLTESLLNSKIAVILMVTTVDSEWIPSESKESALYLLCKISENKIENQLYHKMSYELDIRRLLDLMHCKLKPSTIQSGFRLLVTSLDFQKYFASPHKTLQEKKSEIIAIVFWCVNNLMIHTIELSEYTPFFKTLLASLEAFNPILKKHFLDFPLNELIITKLVKDNENHNLSQDLIKFFEIFCHKECTKNYAINAINKLTEQLIEDFENQMKITEDIENNGEDNRSYEKGLELLKTIHTGVCRRVLHKAMKVKLNQVMARQDSELSSN